MVRIKYKIRDLEVIPHSGDYCYYEHLEIFDIVINKKSLRVILSNGGVPSYTYVKKVFFSDFYCGQLPNEAMKLLSSIHSDLVKEAWEAMKEFNENCMSSFNFHITKLISNNLENIRKELKVNYPELFI